MKMEELPRPPALTCTPDETLEAVATRMCLHEVTAFAVVTGRYVVGMISTLDLVRAIADGTDLRRAIVRDYSVPVYDVALPSEDTWHVARRMLTAGDDHIPVIDGRTVTNVVPLRQLVAVEPPSVSDDDAGDDDWALQFGDAAGWLEHDVPRCPT